MPPEADGPVFLSGVWCHVSPATDKVCGRSQDKQFRRLKEGDMVQAGQLLAYLDDQLDRDDWAIKNARLTSSKADLEAARAGART